MHVRRRPVFLTVLVMVVVLLMGHPVSRAAARQGTSDAATPSPLTGAPGSLQEMSHALPDLLGEHEETGWYLTYANIAAHTAALGIPLPASPNDASYQPWLDAERRLELPRVADEWDLPDWQATLGFQPFQVDQAIEFTDFDVFLTFLRGRFDADDLRAAWSRSGYQETTVGDSPVWFFHGDGYMDFNQPISSLAVGLLNYVTITPDGMVVFANTFTGMASVIGTALGLSPSLADRDEIQAVLGAAGEDLTSIRVFDGSNWVREACCDPAVPPEARDTEQQAIETLTASYGPMPSFLVGLLGEAPPGPSASDTSATTSDAAAPGGRLEIALLFKEVYYAASARANIPGRIKTMWSTTYQRPYNEIFHVRSAIVLDDLPVVVVHLDTYGDQFGILRDLASAGDVRFLLADARY